MIEKIREAASFLQPYIEGNPTGIILGSGLGEFAESFTETRIIPYEEIPFFPRSTVEGHAGNLVIGKLEGKDVLALQGRFHYYEGYSMDKVTFPVRVMGFLGLKNLIITNAAGGINREFSPGDLMLITDHINLMGDNPLRGYHNEEFGPRFPDLTGAYGANLLRIAEEAARARGILIRRGVYAAMSGPSYESPAEIRMLSRMGADAVGMSTVPEVIVAAQMGIKVLGISCITNMAAGVSSTPLSHEEVMETAERVKEDFKALLTEIIRRIDR